MPESQFSDHEEKRFSIFDIKISKLNGKRILCKQNEEAYLLILICILLLAVPAQNTTIFGLIMSSVLLVFGIISLARWLRPSEEREARIEKNLPLLSIQRLNTPLPSVVEGLLSILLAAALLVFPEIYSVYVVRAVGVYFIVWFLISLYRTVTHQDESSTHGLAWHVFMVSIGGFLIIWPLLVVELLSTVASVIGLVIAVLVIMINLFSGRTRALSLNRFPSYAMKWLEDRSVTKADREHLYESIFYEGRNTQKRINHFVVLMVLASAIASFGVIANSTAVVIGAMLVAPLMTPLMAVATSIVMGWPQRLVRSLTLSTIGAGIGVGVGWLIGMMIPGEISIIENNEISSRVLPTLLDLGIAVAAGAAGAYSMSRPDLSDSLSGVAVSIALVPPLAVTGITLQQGAVTEASGSFLLFLTNAVAILVAGGVVMVLTGVTPLSRIRRAQKRLRTVLLALEMVGILILGALILNGENIASSAFAETQTRATVTEWLGGNESDFRLNSLRFEKEGTHLVIEVTGPETPPSGQGLQDLLKKNDGREFSIDLRFTAQERELIR